MTKNGVSGLETIDSIDDLSSWEFVSPSQSDDEEELYSFDDVAYSAVESEQEGPTLDPHPPSHDDTIFMESLSVSPPPLTLHVDFTHQVYHDDSEYDDENEGSGLDDELVPLKLKNRFGKQRIRKIGKRGGTRINKSKKVSYYYNRPGCVYGKHGLGVQLCFI
ncbi:uncharacterized protein LOC111411207 [Olea europaea var. sylvestris]|uniref:uncharacterized protein LOC111411207 n=1 Tax=Olea europaea var. sylvestris TaxID=158386 RepID=UPI000C1CF644|nr:uncharacterized protein LOC111411207 [Olea europaea var. sylvestris]